MLFWGMFFVYTILFGVLTAVVWQEKRKKYYLAAKGMNSLAFLVVLFVSGAVSGELMQLVLMFPAFLCCFAGDILLAVYHRSQKSSYFLLGLVIFLAGHICFVRWMCRAQKLTITDFWFPAAAVFIVLCLMRLPGMHTGRMKPFILIYTFFVAMLFAKGIHLAVSVPSLQTVMAAAGGTLFLASDISILFLYFYKGSGRKVHVFNLGTYYYGMYLLSANLLFFQN